LNEQAGKAEAQWQAHVDPYLKEMAKPHNPNWKPVRPAEFEPVDVNAISTYGNHVRPAVIQGMYPFTCGDDELLRADGTCPKPGEVPVMMWPMGRGPSSEYEGAESFNTSAFHACCKTENEIARILPNAGASDPKALQSLYLEAVAEAHGLARDIDRNTTKVVKMWKAAETRELTRVPPQEREEVEMALAYLMQIAYLISSDLETIQSVNGYTEAVISGSAAAMRGAMPRLEGMDHSSALDYMRAEFYYRLGRFLSLFGVASHNKDPLYEMNRDDVWTKMSLGFVPRGVNAVVNAGYRGVKKMSLLSSLAFAVPIIMALRGLQTGSKEDNMSNMFQGFFSTDAKWTKANALLLTVLLEFFLETRITADDPSDLTEEGEVINGVLNGAKHYAEKYHGWNKMLAKTASEGAPGTADFLMGMGGPQLLGGVGSFIGIGSKLWGAHQDYQQGMLLTGLTGFGSVVALGAKLYPEFAEGGPLMLAVHNALWVGAGSYTASMALKVLNTQSTSWFDFSGMLNDFLDTPAEFSEMVGNVLNDPETGLLVRFAEFSSEDIRSFMLNRGPQTLMSLIALLYIADKLSGDMPKNQHKMLEEVELWAPRRAEGFFAQNQSFLPQVDDVLFNKYCSEQGRTDCTEKLAMMKKARGEVQQGCHHMNQIFRDRGYRVCDDY
jgi:hypothetical protein